ncbi:hypothetical protein JGH11_17105 [Dysgonomonas sp. Marseille-P4677]|uniref:hypothetical protein n=1 Tax=Dysgonomonas sp. Marseille-P4677 TaxID=2364790 RepID=UPI001913B3B1|nr:hypothetical protein [Dysgonomonas sp. Marseille-P4677]MBK5722595.1 hypothetical protein [Dysgonomonas sp. Marseille-P4677]
MKTKFKHLTLMATALIFGLSSCSNDDEIRVREGEGTPKSLFLKISGSSPATYAEGSVQGTGPVTFSKGLLYFTDNDGVIKSHYTIGTEATDDINIAELTTTGKAISNLPGDVSAVYIVGNTLDNLPTSGNISAVKAVVLNVETQGTITDVSLYGETTSLTSPEDPENPDAYYTCTVNLAPVVARFELTDIKASGNVITGFKIAGIFIDNYFSQATVNGSVTAGNLKDNGASAIAFNDNSEAYPESLKPFIYDWYTDLNADNNTVTPPTGAVWGYNVFATAAGSAVPRIVIRLTDITTTTASGVTYPNEQFITIKGFKKEGGASLETIKAGEVYSISTGLLNFDETDLAGTPNLSTIDVEVTVTLANWVPVAVTPEL